DVAAAAVEYHVGRDSSFGGELHQQRDARDATGAVPVDHVSENINFLSPADLERTTRRLYLPGAWRSSTPPCSSSVPGSEVSPRRSSFAERGSTTSSCWKRRTTWAGCGGRTPTPAPAVTCLHRCTRSRSDRKSTRLNSSHVKISYAVFCLKKKTT